MSSVQTHKDVIVARVSDVCVERRIDGIVHLDIQIHLVVWGV